MSSFCSSDLLPFAKNRRSLNDDPKELRITVDLDAERGVTPRSDKHGKPHENKVRVRITKSKRIDLDVLKAYLAGTKRFTDHVLECISKVSSFF